MPYALDLFCGAGGMSEGILQAGFHILFSSDVSEDVQLTYVNRHEQLGLTQGVNTYYHRGDICDLTGNFIWGCIGQLEMFNRGGMPGQIDAVFGGPPCQGFSRAGRRQADDPRNLLFREYLRVINEVHPRYVVMENVEGFNDTKFFGFSGVTGQEYQDGMLAPDILIQEFNLIGYNVLQPMVLDASDYGVPQRRRRAIFIAYLDGQNPPIYPPAIFNDQNRLPLLTAVGDLIGDDAIRNQVNPELTQYQIDSINGRTPHTVTRQPINSNREIHNNELSAHQDIIIERFNLFREGEDGSAIRRRILQGGIDLAGAPHLVGLCSKKLNISNNDIIQRFIAGDATPEMMDVLLTKKTIRTKLYRDRPSLTVVTLPDDYISPFENRTFSVREMARIQSFDDSFVFLSKRTTGGPRRRLEVPQYTQVGNAVPPLLASAIATQILNAINGIG